MIPMIYRTGIRRGIYRDEAGRVVVVYSYLMRHEVQTAVYNRLYELQHAGHGYWFRATNNAREHLICANLRSRNHLDGSMEAGMSVSEHPAYQLGGYKYIYVVTGDVIGTGSDGEPVLANARALTKPARTLPAEWRERYRRDCILPGLSEEETRSLQRWCGQVEYVDDYECGDLTLIATF